MVPLTWLNSAETELLLARRTSASIHIKEVREETEHDDAQRTRRGDYVTVVAWTRHRIAAFASATVLVGVVAAVFYLWGSSKSTKSVGEAALRPTVRTIAVLPFKTLGVAEEDRYIELGLTDAVITRLGSLKRIIIRPTSAVQKFAGADQDPFAAGRELGVDAVLEGYVQRSSEGFRVTVQLLSVRDGTQLWAGKFDEKLTALFAVEDSISNEVAQALTSNLTADERDLLTKHYTQNPEAYIACLKGRYFWNKRTAEGFKKAIEFFEQARQLDPNCALAYAGLGDCYILAGLPADGKSQDVAKTFSIKALELDDTLAEAHTTLAYYLGAIEWDWSGAEREFARAIELKPNYVTAHHWHAYNLASMGNLNEALAEIKRARDSDPLSLIINTDMGHVLYLAKQYDQAIRMYQETLELDPSFSMAHVRLGEAYIQKGMYQEALRELRTGSKLYKGRSDALMMLAYVNALLGRRAEAARALDEYGGQSKSDQAPYVYATIYTGLGDKERAFECLEKAAKVHAGPMALLKVEPRFDSLRSDPRFTKILSHMRLAG